MKPGAHDPLRAHLPRGSVAARDRSAPRLVWGWPLGLASISALAVILFLGWQMFDEGVRVQMPILTSSGNCACLSMQLVPGYGNESSREEHKPVFFALWEDGTFVWSEHGPDAPGRPYRIGLLPAEDVRTLLAQARTRIQSLPLDRRHRTVIDCEWVEVCLAGASGTCRMSWSPFGGVPEDLGAVRHDVIAALLAARPTKSEPLQIEAFDFKLTR